jgi:ketosteroid isomerase-like protein
MTREDVESARDGFRTLAEEGYEATLERFHPEFEMTTPVGQAVEPQTYRGREGVRRWFESFYEIMDDIRVEPERLEDLGEGRLLAEITLRARGQSTGLETEQRTFSVVTLEDGLIRRFEFFPDAASARAAAGSADQPGTPQ